ncbi:uncharacterized protein LOC144784001 [Lissotriton helveticus]
MKNEKEDSPPLTCETPEKTAEQNVGVGGESSVCEGGDTDPGMAVQAGMYYMLQGWLQGAPVPFSDGFDMFYGPQQFPPTIVMMPEKPPHKMQKYILPGIRIIPTNEFYSNKRKTSDTIPWLRMKLGTVLTHVYEDEENEEPLEEELTPGPTAEITGNDKEDFPPLTCESSKKTADQNVPLEELTPGPTAEIAANDKKDSHSLTYKISKETVEQDVPLEEELTLCPSSKITGNNKLDSPPQTCKNSEEPADQKVPLGEEFTPGTTSEITGNDKENYPLLICENPEEPAEQNVPLEEQLTTGPTDEITGKGKKDSPLLTSENSEEPAVQNVPLEEELTTGPTDEITGKGKKDSPLLTSENSEEPAVQNVPLEEELTPGPSAEITVNGKEDSPLLTCKNSEEPAVQDVPPKEELIPGPTAEVIVKGKEDSTFLTCESSEEQAVLNGEGILAECCHLSSGRPRFSTKPEGLLAECCRLSPGRPRISKKMEGILAEYCRLSSGRARISRKPHFEEVWTPGPTAEINGKGKEDSLLLTCENIEEPAVLDVPFKEELTPGHTAEITVKGKEDCPLLTCENIEEPAILDVALEEELTPRPTAEIIGRRKEYSPLLTFENDEDSAAQNTALGEELPPDPTAEIIVRWMEYSPLPTFKNTEEPAAQNVPLEEELTPGPTAGVTGKGKEDSPLHTFKNQEPAAQNVEENPLHFTALDLVEHAINMVCNEGETSLGNTKDASELKRTDQEESAIPHAVKYLVKTVIEDIEGDAQALTPSPTNTIESSELYRASPISYRFDARIERHFDSHNLHTADNAYSVQDGNEEPSLPNKMDQVALVAGPLENGEEVVSPYTERSLEDFSLPNMVNINDDGDEIRRNSKMLFVFNVSEDVKREIPLKLPKGIDEPAQKKKHMQSNGKGDSQELFATAGPSAKPGEPDKKMDSGDPYRKFTIHHKVLNAPRGHRTVDKRVTIEQNDKIDNKTKKLTFPFCGIPPVPCHCKVVQVIEAPPELKIDSVQKKNRSQDEDRRHQRDVRRERAVQQALDDGLDSGLKNRSQDEDRRHLRDVRRGRAVQQALDDGLDSGLKNRSQDEDRRHPCDVRRGRAVQQALDDELDSGLDLEAKIKKQKCLKNEQKLADYHLANVLRVELQAKTAQITRHQRDQLQGNGSMDCYSQLWRYLELISFFMIGPSSWWYPTWTNFPAKPLIASIPYEEFMRLKRNCSKEEDAEENNQESVTRLRMRGYNERILKKCKKRIDKKTRAETLIPKSKERKDHGPKRFVTTYSKESRQTINKIKTYWHLIAGDPDIEKTLGRRPVVTYRKTKSLKDVLVTSHFQKS